ncbi:glucuronate isomerase [Virgibacillus natechei]|uniref:Uronate isomerase n=1 Tax=Virgibacillus natechei TaxID=1216297 RepID=A0ABS4ICH9_9BACI|nr:glucuronate isomerase [Virgibacillus natechei]MBP1968558.1 glucuronate isomerase [Virgibacillus natechei]UZD13669.1 glucuronate isomerase [Virgibacillus natechei]
MKTFITDDFLLYNETAKDLYHNTAKHLPIIDYHNHLNQEEILQDKNYTNLSEIWLAGDHYKWRAMRANGIDEAYITGDKSDYEKFLAWAKTVPNTFGNPLYHWTHLELLRYFDIDEVLNEETAPAIWEEAKRKLATPEMSVRSLLEKDKVEFVGTTDDPTDDLASHIQLAKEGFSANVSPSFRPDKGLGIEKEDFLPWVEKLGQVTNVTLETYDAFLDALASRVDYFDEHGCRSSDHGINVLFYEKASKDEVSAIFVKRLKGEALSAKEIDQFKTYTLLSLGELYADKGWAMQLHISPLRNNNTKMFKKLGPDSGFDSIGDPLVADKLSGLLDSMEEKGKLPKTILYSLNANDYNVLAAMAGNYQNAEIPGKVQFGTAWWFNDTIDGMEDQMKTLANIGLISNFIGMLTDSRSFLSLSRHEYFRRILCNLLGTWVEEGKVPKDMALLEKYVRGICHENAKQYFAI